MDLARSGDITASLAAISNMQQLDPQLVISADTWNEICRNGSLNQQAARVLDACTKGVTAAPDDGSIRNNRGLALTLTGKLKGVIEDFEFSVAQSKMNNNDEETIKGYDNDCFILQP